jgi:hypothetical protein
MFKKVKVILQWFGIGMLLALVFGVTWTVWKTRRSAMIGEYRASGVWGESSLTLKADHTFVQEARFMEYDQPVAPPYPRHTVMQRVISGKWEEHGRHYFDQDIELKPFISLVRSDRGKTMDEYRTSFGLVGLAFGIEIDEGAGIVYWK